MTYRLAIIGAAGHVQLVLQDLQRYPQVQWVAYAPSFPGEDVSRYEKAQMESRPKAYADWRQMLDAERLDIVTVCGRYDLNGPIAIEAVRRGCHVISEKPAAQTLAELESLSQAIARGNVRYAIMLAMRYDAPYFTAHELVRQGLIGEPFLVTAQKSYRWGNRPEWYADPAKYGNSMTWVGIHAFDFARWVSGVEYTEVYAYHANLVHKERPGCQDVATIIARLANGGAAAFNLDYLRPQAAPTHGDDRLRIAGAKGVIEICDQGTRVHVITAESNVPAWPLVESGRTLFGDFVAILEGRGSLLVSVHEALSITRFAILAAQAADTGQIVRL